MKNMILAWVSTAVLAMTGAVKLIGRVFKYEHLIRDSFDLLDNILASAKTGTLTAEDIKNFENQAAKIKGDLK